MHECPECGSACSCDMEDTWNDLAADDCMHDCEESGRGWDDEGDEDEDFDPHPNIDNPAQEMFDR